MILHIFPQEKFTNDFINFINKNFSVDEHIFYIVKTKQKYDEIPQYSNVLYLDENIKRFQCDKRKASLIILHQFNLKVVFKYLGKKRYLKNICWIPWGCDLYDKEELQKSIKGYFKFLLKKYFIRRINAVATLVPGDQDVLKKNYGFNNHLYSARYGFYNEDTFQVNSFTPNHNFCNILIGNSASDTCDHIMIFKLLKELSSCNVNIYCPLSYGDKEYANSVSKVGFEIFGSKFHPITEFIPYEQYLCLLKKMDVGIFAMERQQALGNINLMLGLGKKIYINSNSTMWSFFKKYDFDLYDISELKNTDYEKISYFNENSKKRNIDSYKHYSSPQITIELWNNIFSKLAKG